MQLSVDEHPDLRLVAFTATFPAPLGEQPSPPWLVELLELEAEAPLSRTEATRKAVRDLLRHGGYKPTGRGKPASEYLVRAATQGTLGSINPAVDVCNVVSLHSGLPASVIDLDRATPPFRVGLAEEGASYVFNQAGQTIRVGGLLCLHDADGPCANAVKDAQRTKTGPETRRTLILLWGLRADPERTDAAAQWYQRLLGRLGAETETVVAPGAHP